MIKDSDLKNLGNIYSGINESLDNLIGDIEVDNLIQRIPIKPYVMGSYTINNGIIDIDGSLYLRNFHLPKLPWKFGTVNGFVDISDSKLESLEGMPHTIKSGFIMTNTAVKSLEHFPKYVYSIINCCYNLNLTSLIGMPEEIIGLYCEYSSLKNLIGSPKKCTGTFSIKGCQNIKSLEGAPQFVRDNFDCYNTSITNLVGGPIYVGSNYNVSSCNLQSLDGAPNHIGGNLILSDNPINNLNGLKRGVVKHNIHIVRTKIDPELVKQYFEDNYLHRILKIKHEN